MKGFCTVSRLFRSCVLAAIIVLPASLAGPSAQAASSDIQQDDDPGLLFNPAAAIAKSQAAIGRPVSDYSFRDQDSREVKLSDYRGKPLVIAMIYTACTQSCPLLIEKLAQAVEQSDEAFGEESFAVAAIGFDPTGDRPSRLKAYGLSHGIDMTRWRFLSAEAPVLDALIEDLGFIRQDSPRGFDHIAQTSILDGQQRVYAQVYGSAFEATALAEPLKALLYKQAGQRVDLTGLIERVRLFCTYYDPKKGRYEFDYAVFISFAIALAVLFGIAVVLIRNLLRLYGPSKGGTP